MRLLLDTHTLLWWIFGDRRLSALVRSTIDQNEDEVLVSAVSIFEITTKHRLGKLEIAAPLVSDMAGVVASQGFSNLPLTLAHAQRAGTLPGPHADSFDRMLIAQAIVDDLVLVSNERPFDLYGVRRLW